MKEVYNIIIPLRPEGKARHRSRIVKSLNSQTKPFISEYPDPKQKEHLKLVEAYIRDQFKRPPLEGPLIFGVAAHMPMPTSRPKKWKAEALAGKHFPTTKPDLDNIVKLIEDVANGILYKDDSQIVGFSNTFKKYSEHPRYCISIREYKPDE